MRKMERIYGSMQFWIILFSDFLSFFNKLSQQFYGKWINVNSTNWMRRIANPLLFPNHIKQICTARTTVNSQSLLLWFFLQWKNSEKVKRLLNFNIASKRPTFSTHLWKFINGHFWSEGQQIPHFDFLLFRLFIFS